MTITKQMTTKIPSEMEMRTPRTAERIRRKETRGSLRRRTISLRTRYMSKPRKRIDYFGLPTDTTPVDPLEPTSVTARHEDLHQLDAYTEGIS